MLMPAAPPGPARILALVVRSLAALAPRLAPRLLKPAQSSAAGFSAQRTLGTVGSTALRARLLPPPPPSMPAFRQSLTVESFLMSPRRFTGPRGKAGARLMGAAFGLAFCFAMVRPKSVALTEPLVRPPPPQSSPAASSIRSLSLQKHEILMEGMVDANHHRQLVQHAKRQSRHIQHLQSQLSSLRESMAELQSKVSSQGLEIANLKDKLSLARAPDECVICLDNTPDVIFRPCRHAVCCARCVDVLAYRALPGHPTCPMCRTHVDLSLAGEIG